jgi:hypothetical protein
MKSQDPKLGLTVLNPLAEAFNPAAKAREASPNATI